MAIGLKNERRLSLQVDLKIYRLAVYNLYRLRKASKGRTNFWSDISDDRQINKGLIVWISGFKSDRRLRLRPDPNFQWERRENINPKWREWCTWIVWSWRINGHIWWKISVGVGADGSSWAGLKCHSISWPSILFHALMSYSIMGVQPLVTRVLVWIAAGQWI